MTLLTRNSWTLPALICSLGLTVSCTSGVMSPTASTGSSPKDTARNKEASAEGFEVQLVDVKGLENAVSQFKGKVVLVDCWAIWCEPCKRLLPHTVELGQRYRDDLAVISLSFDSLEKGQPSRKVREYLKNNKITFDLHLQSKIDISEDNGDAFDIENGVIPHIKIYGRDGKLFKVLASGDDLPAVNGPVIDAALEAALNAK